MPYIGQPIAWTPCAYCNLDGKENPKSTRERTKVHGKIVWINEEHHFFWWRRRSAGTRCASALNFEGGA